jgi:hypothetical protein
MLICFYTVIFRSQCLLICNWLTILYVSMWLIYLCGIDRFYTGFEYRESGIPNYFNGHIAIVTGQLRFLTPPLHLILPLHLAGSVLPKTQFLICHLGDGYVGQIANFGILHLIRNGSNQFVFIETCLFFSEKQFQGVWAWSFCAM